MILRDTSELRQPLAKEAMAVLTGVGVSITDDVGIGVGDGQARTRILILASFLTGSHVNLIGLAHLRELEFFDVTACLLDFVSEIKDSFVITIKVTRDLSQRQRCSK